MICYVRYKKTKLILKYMVYVQFSIIASNVTFKLKYDLQIRMTLLAYRFVVEF